MSDNEDALTLPNGRLAESRFIGGVPLFIRREGVGGVPTPSLVIVGSMLTNHTV
jgi:hypothetical protein